jgi:Tol biopolymer transport system component
MNPDGSNVVRRTFSQSHSQNPAWSPDGTRIAYSTRNYGDIDIWVVGAESGSPSPLSDQPGRKLDPSWSPDGAKLVLVSDDDIGTEVYTINSGGTNFTLLNIDNVFDAISYQRYPRWSPSGMKIAISITKINLIYGDMVDVGVMNSDGSGLTIMIFDADSYTRTSWSPDGTSILYTSLSGSRKDISWVSLDESVHGTIVTNGWNADWQH